MIVWIEGIALIAAGWTRDLGSFDAASNQSLSIGPGMLPSSRAGSHGPGSQTLDTGASR